MVTPHHLNRLNILPDKYLISMEPTKFTDQILAQLHSRKSTIPFKKSMTPMASDNENLITINGKSYPHLSISNNQSTSKHSRKTKKSRDDINDFDLSLLLRMALIKIPQIPFQYIMDAFRWNLFNGTIDMNDANAFYWNLALNEQGIHPPDWKDRRDLFDLGAKFHTADNTPYMRFVCKAKKKFHFLML